MLYGPKARPYRGLTIPVCVVVGSVDEPTISLLWRFDLPRAKDRVRACSNFSQLHLCSKLTQGTPAIMSGHDMIHRIV
jgi:hypothetical protein